MVPNTYPSTGVEWCKKATAEKPFAENDRQSKEMDDLLSHINFLNKLEPVMNTRITQALESSQSISCLLSAWEISIRQTLAVS